MSEEPDHGPTTIRASQGGGGAGKWLIGGLAAVVLATGGYFAWKSMAPNQNTTDIAANDSYYDEPLRAGPLPADQDATAEDSAADESTASPASSEARASAPARRSSARATAVPEETIGITPVNATSDEGDEIVVTAGRRPIWARTPSERRLSALYPASALERGREGEARLHCIVQDGGALDCERLSETSRGFGNAAMRVARTYRHAPQLRDGSDAAGTPVNLRVVFRIADEQRG